MIHASLVAAALAMPVIAGAAQPEPVAPAAEPAPVLYPYIQTHVFDLRPLWPEVKRGYALFIASGHFNGKEEVSVFAPEGQAFPDGNAVRHLTSFERRGEWMQPQAERVTTAQGGGLKNGTYRFVVKPPSGARIERAVTFDGRYLDSSAGIRVNRLASGLRRVSWKAPAGADSFLVFLVRDGSTDVLKDMVMVSHPNHPAPSLDLAPGLVAPGRYWVLVRANQHLPGGVPGYARESWGASPQAFDFSSS